MMELRSTTRERQQYFSTDLGNAAGEGDLNCVRSLVENGADMEEGDWRGGTPLFLASRKGHLHVVKYLVEQGASLDTPGKNCILPDEHPTALLVAASAGHLDICRYLLEQGADREKSCPHEGRTPLHYAANNNNLEVLMLLMSYGANLNARSVNGRLPIDMPNANELIKQAIRDEPRRRMDHGHKRATEQDRHPNTVTQQENDEEEEKEEQSNKRPRLDDEGAVAVVGAQEEETKVASEDEDSEQSSDEEEDN